MIFICKTCGRRKPNPEDPYYGKDRCRDKTHTGETAFTDSQARELAKAAKAYNSAKQIEDRATAFNDWLDVLTEGLPEHESEQLGMGV